MQPCAALLESVQRTTWLPFGICVPRLEPPEYFASNLTDLLHFPLCFDHHQRFNAKICIHSRPQFWIGQTLSRFG